MKFRNTGTDFFHNTVFSSQST